MNTASISSKRQCGLTYIEVLVASILLSLALLPAMDALHSGVQGSAIAQSRMQQHYALQSRMETLLGEPYSALLAAAQAAGSETTPSSYSEAPGTVNRRLVYLSLYDGDNADADDNPFTGKDDGLLWIRVAIENTPHAFESLRTN